MPPLRRLALCAALSAAATAAAAQEVTVFAAASLGGALDAAAAAWDGGGVTISYAGSATLARQIAAGAPADVVILANADWMEVLAEAGAVEAESARILLTNDLVLVGPVDAVAPVDDLAAALAALPGDALVATGFVDAVPAGIYARQSLEASGLWAAWEGRLLQTENVRLALALAARGEAARAITYRTDALAEPRVAVEVTIPSELHDAIVYPAAVVAGAESAEAAAFLDFLSGAAAQAIFAAHGFGPPR